MMQEQQHPLQLAIEELKKMPTIDIKGKSYTQVSTRVAVFRKYFPDASISTQILHDDSQRVVVQATIKVDDVILSTGLSEEVRGEGWINSTSALENAETSSIGRALAGMSLSGNEYASSFEVANAQEQQKHTNNASYNQQQQSQQPQQPNYNQSPNHPPQQNQQPYQHQQDFSQLTSLGLQVMQQGDNLVVVGKNQFENKTAIRNAGFFWNSENKTWFMPLRQAA